MSHGFVRDGNIQEQIDDTIADAVAKARGQLPVGASARRCNVCDNLIPEARRQAVPGVQLCLMCQADRE